MKPALTENGVTTCDAAVGLHAFNSNSGLFNFDNLQTLTYTHMHA